MRIVRFGFALAMLAASLPTQAQAPERGEARLHRIEAALPPPTATIRYGDTDLQSGQLRLPTGNGPFPVAILVHGGCFVSTSGGVALEGMAEMLRKRGFATWDIDYRRIGHDGGGWPGSFRDIAAGVDHLSTIADKYRLDMSRVTIAGHSAGTLFALWATARPKLSGEWRAGAASPRFRSVFVIDGPGDLAPLIGPDRHVCDRPVIVPLMGGTPAERPEAYAIATPANHLPLGLPQYLVLANLGDFMRPYAEAVKAAGDPIETLNYPESDHFDVVTPGDPRGEAVADWIAANAFKPR